MKKHEDLIKKTLIISAIASIAYLIVDNIHFVLNVVEVFLTTLRPLFIGVLIALVLGVPLNAIEKKIKKKTKTTRIITVVCIYIATFAIVSLLAVVIIPNIYDSLIRIISNFSSYLVSIAEPIDNLLEKIGLSEYTVKVDEIMNIPVEDFAKYLAEWLANIPTIGEWISASIPELFKDISNIAVAVISVIVSALMSVIFSIYILINKETYTRQIKKVIDAFVSTKAAKVIKHICQESYITFSNFIQGQIVEISILGTLFFVVMSVVKLPFALLISVIIAVTAIVPYFGTTFAMIIGALLILADAGLIKMIIFIIIFIVIQQIENNLIYPKVVGTSVGLPGIWVLLSVSIFGELLGILGLAIGVPLMAVIYTLFKEIVNNKVKNRKENQEV